MMTFASSGTINRMNPRDKALIISIRISNQISRDQGQEVILTNGVGGKASGPPSFKFYGIDHANPAETMNRSGAVFYSNATGTLKSISNSVGIFKDRKQR